jgi:hypothetical protein
MYTEHCDLKGKPGVAWLETKEPYAVIVNKALFERGKMSRYAVVHTSECFVDSIYDSRKAAAAQLKKKVRSESHSRR